MLTRSDLPTAIVATTGGAGATTITATLAALTHGSAWVARPHTDPESVEDLAAVAGLPVPTDPAAVLTFGPHPETAPVYIDHGTTFPTDWPGPVVILVRGPSYLALRRALPMVAARPDADVIVLTEPGRALSVDDAESVLGVTVAAVIEQDPAVSRAVDAGLLAGLLAARAPRTLARNLAPITRHHATT